MPNFDFAKRRDRLAGSHEPSTPGHRAFLICHPIDINYLTGVDEGISWLALWEDGGFAITRHMLMHDVEAAIGDFELLLPSERSIDRVKLEDFLTSELSRRGINELLLDPARISAASYKSLEKSAAAAGLKISDAPSLVSRQRQCKDAEEHQTILRCVGIAEQAFSELIERGSKGLIGRTEREIARELEGRM
ncbi:aminopeptidase P family N-terminal domain-containing protein [Haloferula sp.]|uniref:aminopeptidase P family N-terminal domain-containing protein n=1 Tax=Haloferula sp. TaxID=2497595 RepID=UPI003C72FFE6